MIDFRIETFLTLCKLKNYTKTANEINITQPAVTQHIQYLENKYNTKLFIKDGKTLTITESGELLKNFCEKIKAEELKLKKCFIEKDKVKLNFGATLTIGEYIMPQLISKYLKENPNNEICMDVQNTNVLLYKLNKGLIDFALIEGNFQKNNYSSKILSIEKFIGVSSTELELNDPVTLDELCNYSLISRVPGSGTRNILKTFISENNLMIKDFNRVIETNNFKTIKYLLKQNIGISFLYESVVKKELKENILKEINIINFNINHEFNFVYLKDSLFEKQYLEFYNFILKNR